MISSKLPSSQWLSQLKTKQQLSYNQPNNTNYKPNSMHILKPLLFNTIQPRTLLTLPIYHYFRPYVKPRQLYKTNQLPKDQLQSKWQKLDASYWEPLMATIEPPAAKVIKTLLNPKSSQREISRELQEYLEFRNFTFTENVRTVVGCAAVLVAMHQCSSSENQEQYQNRIVDFVTLTDLKTNSYDSVMLKHLIPSINKRINMNIQKNIRQYYRLKMVEILIDNFQRVDNRDLFMLTKIIEESMEKDCLNFITKWRFYPLVQAIFTRLFNYMETYVQTTDFQKRKQIQMIIHPQLFHKIIRLIYAYGHLLPEHAMIIFRYFISRNDRGFLDHNAVFNFLNTLSFIPYTEVFDEDGKKTTIRRKLLEYLQQNYDDEYSPLKKGWKDFALSPKKYTFQRFFEDEFHSLFKSLPFEKHQDKYLMLKKQHLTIPPIPEFLWQLFKQEERTLINKQIIKHLITNFYPERISIPKSEWPTFSEHKIDWTAQNEANLKIWQALQRLGYQFKKEQFCAERLVDILIDDEIAVEVDGEGHYMFLSNQLSPETSLRNMQLMLSGYKLVVISMFEYNNNRNLKDLEKLIKEKVELVKNHGYVYVC